MAGFSTISIGLVTNQLGRTFSCVSLGGIFNIYKREFSYLSLGVKVPKLIIKVIDRSGNPLIGASVKVNETTCLTDQEGKVFLDYDYGAVTPVQVSYKGKITAAFSLQENRLLDLILPIFDQVQVYHSISHGTLVNLAAERVDNEFLS